MRSMTSTSTAPCVDFSSRPSCSLRACSIGSAPAGSAPTPAPPASSDTGANVSRWLYLAVKPVRAMMTRPTSCSRHATRCDIGTLTPPICDSRGVMLTTTFQPLPQMAGIGAGGGDGAVCADRSARGARRPAPVDGPHHSAVAEEIVTFGSFESFGSFEGTFRAARTTDILARPLRPGSVKAGAAPRWLRTPTQNLLTEPYQASTAAPHSRVPQPPTAHRTHHALCDRVA